MAKYKVVVADPVHDDHQIERDVLRSIDAEVFIRHCLTPAEVLEACRDADGILVGQALFPAEVVHGLTRCKVISRYGIGYDNIDIAACTEQGIRVANVVNYCLEEVSDHALALLMCCVRRIVQRDRLVRLGQWRAPAGPVFRMAGKSFAFLGFGMIARCLCRKLQGMEFARILVYDPYVSIETIRNAGAIQAELDEVLEAADYISIHMPLNDQTWGLFGESAIRKVKKNVIVINTSRGSIINQNALVKALQDGRILAAGLDVYENEPLNPDNPLTSLTNCILTDHISWYSEESVVDLARLAAENVRNVLLGEKPLFPLNFLNSS